MSTTKIGVVMTCRNGWDYTRAALETITSAHELAVIVVDDGSTDGTKPGLKKWQSEDKANRWYMQDPPFDSLAGKWNAGVRKAWELGCDYVCVANNDILLHPQTLDRLAARLGEGDVVMATGHDIAGIFKDKGIPPEFITDERCTIDEEHTESEAPDFSCFMISRECWEEIGQFDERFVPAYFEDNDYHERIIRAGKKAVNVPQAPYYHYGSVTQNLDPTPDPEKHLRFERTRHEFVEKWGFVPQGNARVPDKLKLLVVGDGHRPTGFARVVHSILRPLALSGDYDVHHLAINYHGDPYDEPWRMYPAHLSSPPDLFGRGRVRELYDKLKPDAVLMVQDPWHISDYVTALQGMRGLVAYYPIDSPNVDPMWVTVLARCVEVCTYTRFAAQESADAAQLAVKLAVRDIMEGGTERVVGSLSVPNDSPWSDPNVAIPFKRLYEMQDPDAYHVLPHGVDDGLFGPAPKELARQRFGLPLDAFVVGYVHRNQPRKRQDAMMRAFAKFVRGLRDEPGKPLNTTAIREAPDKVTDARLVIHAALDDQAGWDLHRLARSYGIEHLTRFTKPASGALSEADLNLLYNAFDVNCNVGGGEGWGLSHMESGICGVAQLVPDWSATGEIWKDNAVLVGIKEVHHTEHHLNTMQAVVDTDAAADALRKLYAEPDYRRSLGERARALCSRDEFSWDTIAGRFAEIIQQAARKKGVPHTPVRLTREAA